MGQYVEITKLLSRNDTGQTGSHQAGIHIPKTPEFLSFFPPLDVTTKNPDALLSFIDEDDEVWEFRYIYYNGKLFGGTRNEYRLTRMTGFVRHHALKAGNSVTFRLRPHSSFTYCISTEPLGSPPVNIRPLRIRIDESWTALLSSD